MITSGLIPDVPVKFYTGSKIFEKRPPLLPSESMK